MRVRQAVGLGVALLLIIVVVLGVKGCVSSQQENSLKAYNRDVTSVISSSDRDVGQALFRLLGNGSQQGQDLQVQVNQLRLAADEDARRARKFDVPGDMKAAQDKLLLTLDLRAEGLRKIAADLPTALGRGQAARTAVARIAGNMQYFLSSDVVYKARVAPLIKQTLDDAGVTGQQIADSQFMGNIAWLSPTFVAQQIGATAGATEPAARARPPRPRPRPACGRRQHAPARRRSSTASRPRRRVTFHVDLPEPGRQRRERRARTVTVRGSGKTIAARKTRRADEGRRSRPRSTSRSARRRRSARRERERRRRGRPGRAEDRQQPPDLHGDLHALRLRSPGAAVAPGEPATARRSVPLAPAGGLSFRAVDELTTTTGIAALAAGALALIALLWVVVLTRRVSKLRSRSASSSASATPATSSATPPSSTATSARCTATSRTSRPASRPG